jgi:hypothetical protein
MVRQVLLVLLVQQALLEWQVPQALLELKVLKDSLAPQDQMERP